MISMAIQLANNWSRSNINDPSHICSGMNLLRNFFDLIPESLKVSPFMLAVDNLRDQNSCEQPKNGADNEHYFFLVFLDLDLGISRITSFIRSTASRASSGALEICCSPTQNSPS